MKLTKQKIVFIIAYTILLGTKLHVHLHYNIKGIYAPASCLPCSCP